MFPERIPYGISDFRSLIEGNYLYVDKTKYIELLETYAPYQFFIRPRRFGKSLFLSMLEYYYDISKKDIFENLFKGLYIQKNQTSQKNSYLVFRLSFAAISTSQGIDKLIDSFDFDVYIRLVGLMNTYSDLFIDETIPEDVRTAEKCLKYICTLAKKYNHKIFLLIDEYDNFANDLITNNQKLYSDIISAEGFVRSFYKTIKEHTANGSISRLFMTGVSPIMLDDLTSGFNITENITLTEDLNEALGFIEEEVLYLTKELVLEKTLNIDILMKDMKKYYNGYLFNENCTHRVFNSDMVLYFLKTVARRGQYPKEIVDHNVRTDYGKINMLVKNFDDENSILEIIENEEISTKLVEKFNLEKMFKKKENFFSLLFYLGMLTIKDSGSSKLTLAIPNYVIKTLYWDYFIEKISEKLEFDRSILEDAITSMCEDGKIDLFAEYLKVVLLSLSNIDLQNFYEKYIKAIILASLNLLKVYIISSERENENGFVDIFLTSNVEYRKYVNYEWIIELKYIKVSQKDSFEEIRKKGIDQITKYSESYKIKYGFEANKLKKVLLICTGKNDVYFEYL